MADVRVDRRLVAILAADVAGYSRLMGRDEEGTLAALKACRRELIDPSLAEHRGRIFKTMGDGVLVEFASAVDAVRCAMEIQRAMVEHNTDMPEDRRIEFRIGINVGDIIIDEGDIYGDGVNIAARVEALATPGAVCLSENAYQQVKGKLALDISDMGERHLKNIAQPGAAGAHLFRPARWSARTSCANSARQAVDRRATVSEHERRSRAGIFR
jgi:adenylate cyclase